MAALGVVVLLATGYSLARLHASRAATVVGLGTIATAPLLLGHVFLNRYDLWPAALVALAVAGYLAGRDSAATAFLAASFAAKIFTVSMVPLAAGRIVATRGYPRARPERRRLLRRLPRDLRLLPRDGLRRPGVQLLDEAQARPARREPARVDSPGARHPRPLHRDDRPRRPGLARSRGTTARRARDTDDARRRGRDRLGLARLPGARCAPTPSSSPHSRPPRSRSSHSPR